MAKKSEQQQMEMQQPIPEVYSNAALANISPYEFEISKLKDLDWSVINGHQNQVSCRIN